MHHRPRAPPREGKQCTVPTGAIECRWPIAPFFTANRASKTCFLSYSYAIDRSPRVLRSLAIATRQVPLSPSSPNPVMQKPPYRILHCFNSPPFASENIPVFFCSSMERNVRLYVVLQYPKYGTGRGVLRVVLRVECMASIRWGCT